MVKLKENPLGHRISWIKKDFKRVIIFLTIPLIVVYFFPYINLGIFRYKFDSQLKLGLSLGFVTFILCFIIQYLSNHKPDYKQELRAALVFSPYLFFINAFVEELFFRGFLQNVLLMYLSPVIAIGIASLIFGYYHIPVFGWSVKKALIAFLGGLYFGIVLYQTKSLLVVWLMHGFGDLGLIHESIGGYIIWGRLKNKELE